MKFVRYNTVEDRRKYSARTIIVPIEVKEFLEAKETQIKWVNLSIKKRLILLEAKFNFKVSYFWLWHYMRKIGQKYSKPGYKLPNNRTVEAL